MTTASTSTYGSSEEKTTGFKLIRLIIDLGTEALRNEFEKIHPAGNLHTVLSSHQPTLNPLKARNIITQPQWDKLYPPVPMIPNIKQFDITLLVILLRNICGIPAPGTGWDKIPVNSDTSLAANIIRVKRFRNEFFGHIPETGVSTTEFEDRWSELSTTLVNLGISQADIDRLKNKGCGEDEVDRVKRELDLLKRMRTEDRDLLLDLQREVTFLKSEKSSSDEILDKYLHSCNFDTDIELLNQKWCKGTRNWVFDQVSGWFNDTASESRAFIITGQAGMGKSVIAAVICKRFAEQLAACHFCQYNNDRYNNPKALLQSIATQLSKVIPKYRTTLVEKVAGKEGKRLDDMNIQALFSFLFKEPLTGIQVAEKHLIVIDAVDESQHEGRSDLVDLIANYLCQLPNFICFLITSRPENAIANKLKKLKPMFLSRKSEQNIEDIHVFFEDRLSGLEQAKHINKLVEKSDGLMLVADCLYQSLKDYSGQVHVDELPSGIEEIYESYFRRLKKELEMLKVSEDNFLSFLSVVAVAREPLPIALVERVLRSDDDPSTISRSKINKIKNCLSMLLVLNDDRITFLHKSVRDWLVESDHEFTADETHGHETLANICGKEMDGVKRNGIKSPFHPASQYALLYGIQHKMAGTQETPLKSFIDWYMTDLEIMYACVIIDVYALLNNIVSLQNNTIYGSLPENTCNSVETLMLIIRKYIGTLKDFPQSFFQCVLNSGVEELSSKAATLLKSRYKEQVYFELTRRNNLEDSLVGRIYLSGPIRGFDISPSEDYLVCGYEDGKLELFSLEDFKPLWTIEADFYRREVPFSDVEPAHPIVFHPQKNVTLPATLDHVVNLEGKAEHGLFRFEDMDPWFDNCCFSNDQSKMATTHKNVVTVWSLMNNDKLRSFSSNNVLTSVMFSADGRFLATSDLRHAFVVYNLEKDFISISKTLNECKFLVSPLKEDSWILGSENGTFIVNSDLCQVDFYPEYLAYPNCCFPLNVKAVAEFEDAMKNREKSWLSRFGYNKFFCLDNGIAVVWEHSMKLKLFQISRLKKVPLKTKNPLVVDAQHIDISVDGKFLYAQQTASLSIHEVNHHSIPSGSSRRWSGIPFSPVANGVFFCGNIDDSRDWFDLDEAGNRRYLSDIPELWNSDLTERLDSFPELSGTKDCLPVSGEIVACIVDGRVLFFNVIKREVISETHVFQNMDVIACSINYHVLMRDNISSGTPPSLCRAGEVTELKDASNETEVLDRLSGFSPSGKTLVLHFQHRHHFYIFDVSPAILRFKIDLEFFGDSGFQKILRFLDEDHFLCPAYYTYICVINVTSGKPLAFIECGGTLGSCCVSRTAHNSSVLLYVKTYKKTKLFKIWCHFKRK